MVLLFLKKIIIIKKGTWILANKKHFVQSLGEFEPRSVWQALLLHLSSSESLSEPGSLSEPTVLEWDKQARETPHIFLKSEVLQHLQLLQNKDPQGRHPYPQLPKSESLKVKTQEAVLEHFTYLEVWDPLPCSYLLWHQKPPLTKLSWKQCPDPWRSKPKSWPCPVGEMLCHVPAHSSLLGWNLFDKLQLSQD